MSKTLDLGDGHALRFMEDGDGHIIGAILSHPFPGAIDNKLTGAIFFDEMEGCGLGASDADAIHRVYSVALLKFMGGGHIRHVLGWLMVGRQNAGVLTLMPQQWDDLRAHLRVTSELVIEEADAAEAVTA